MSDDLPRNLSSCPEADGMSDAEIRRVAKLARLRIDDAKLDGLRAELCKVLGWAELLKEVDSVGSDEDLGAAQIRLDSDQPGTMLDPSVLEEIAPETDGPFIRVPKVLGGGGGA